MNSRASESAEYAVKTIEVEASDGSPTELNGQLKMFSRSLKVVTDSRVELYNVTDRIKDLVKNSGVKAGFLVLSTLHTNDAASTITRMIDMGIEPFNVSSALNCITAQRLVRRICNNCKVEASYLPEVLTAAGISEDKSASMSFFRGEGCDACSGSGYAGRQGLYEVMPMTPTLRRMVLQGSSSDDLKKAAIDEGMITLREDGLLKVTKGVTTLDEVIKETAA